MITERELIARIEGLEVTHLRQWVEFGWIVPLRSGTELVFDDHDAVRAALICELAHDLAIEADSMPVILSLLDQLHGTRRMLRAMAAAIEKQDAAVRASILDEIKVSGLMRAQGSEPAPRTTPRGSSGRKTPKPVD